VSVQTLIIGRQVRRAQSRTEKELTAMAQFQAAPRVRIAAHPPALSRPSGAFAAERRRRERHYRLRRRDLLEDLGAGLLITVLLLMLTAGLGVLALLDLALVSLLVVSSLIGRRRRRRDGPRATRRRRKPVPPRQADST
jgi:membrane protein required for beta-lactamase induction